MRFSPRLVLLAVALAVVVENTCELAQRGLGDLVGLPAATLGAAVLALVAAAWAWWALGGSERVEGRAHAALRFFPALALADALLFYPELRFTTWTAASAPFYLAALAALIAAAVWRRVPGRGIAALALFIALALRVVLILRDRAPLGGDMQGLVDRAAGDLLHGRAPYHWHYVPWAVPLTYLPGTLLAYLPGHALGLVPRWTNLLADGVLAALLVTVARRRDSDHPALPIVGAAFLLQGPLAWFLMTAHPPSWTLLAMALLATGCGHRRQGPAWGLALAASAFAAPLFPVAVAATANVRGGRAALRLASEAVGVAALLVLPFLLWRPGDFVMGTVSWFGDVEKFPSLRWHGFHTWREYPGLAGLFWTGGLQRWLQPLQVALVIALVALFARKGGLPAAAPGYGVAVFLAFMLTNQMLWPYFYQPALVAALCALVSAQIGAGNQRPARGSMSARKP